MLDALLRIDSTASSFQRQLSFLLVLKLTEAIIENVQ